MQRKINCNLFLRLNPIQKREVVTKRDILQQSSKVYDPLGFFSPVTIRAKILLQEIWLQKYDCDTPLPLDVQQRRHGTADELNDVSSQRFQGQYFPNFTATDDTCRDTVLHVFQVPTLVLAHTVHVATYAETESQP